MSSSSCTLFIYKKNWIHFSKTSFESKEIIINSRQVPLVMFIDVCFAHSARETEIFIHLNGILFFWFIKFPVCVWCLRYYSYQFQSYPNFAFLWLHLLHIFAVSSFNFSNVNENTTYFCSIQRNKSGIITQSIRLARLSFVPISSQ